MTEVAVAQSTQLRSADAGADIGAQVLAGLSGERPDVLIVFASPRHDYRQLLEALEATCQPRIMVGCSTAGEFLGDTLLEGSACALAMTSNEMRFAAGVGRGLCEDRASAARQIVSSFKGLSSREYQYRTALVLSDVLAGYTEDLIEQLTVLTAGVYQFVGGGAGDDAKFQSTHVFYGTEPIADAAVALEILSNKPVGIGVSHGWRPASAPLRVTEVDTTRLVSLNAAPVMDVMEEHAERTRQKLDRNDPLPFFLHNVIGIDTGVGHKLRVPLAAYADGSVACASDVPESSMVHIMEATGSSAVEAATRAAEEALRQLGGGHPKVALFFDCVATRIRMGRDFGSELKAVQGLLGLAPVLGCNTYGQIARADGQFSGFHNCTAVVCIIPE